KRLPKPVCGGLAPSPLRSGALAAADFVMANGDIHHNIAILPRFCPLSTVFLRIDTALEGRYTHEQREESPWSFLNFSPCGISCLPRSARRFRRRRNGGMSRQV